MKRNHLDLGRDPFVRREAIVSRRASGGKVFAVGLLILVGPGCVGNGGPQALPPQTVTASDSGEQTEAGQSPVLLTPPTPDVPYEPSPAVDRADSEPKSRERRDDGSLLILGTGDSAPGMTSNRDLVAAARLESERRKTVRPIAVIDDENLAEQAEGGSVTIGNPRDSTAAEFEEARAVLDEFADDEEYWRTRAREIRQRWRSAYDSLDRLEKENSVLRRRFYSEEDVALRDREIKPAWQDSKDLLQEAKETVESAKDDLDLLYLDGRRAGALEGWLRTGIELEPWETDKKRASSRSDDPPRE